MESFDQYAQEYDDLLSDPLRDRFAGGSDFFIHQKCRVLMRHLRSKLGNRRLKLLDAGCGQGTALSFLRTQAAVVGSDVSLPMLKGAAGRGPVVVQEPLDLPFLAATFDAAFAFCVYHHIADADKAQHLRELGRVVKPSGRVCVFEHNPANPVTKRIFERAPVDRGCAMIPRRRLRGLFEESGFDDLVHGYLLFLPEKIWNVIGFVEPSLAAVPLGGQYYVSGRRRP